MSKGKKRHTRKVRRQERASRRNRAARPTHKLKGGRTGSVGGKRTASKKPAKLRTSYPLTAPASVRLAEVKREA